MRRVVIRASLACLVVLLAIQLKQPDRTNPPVDPSRTLHRHLSVPTPVKDILDRACRDCHSNETRWPAYAYVAPFSWDIAGHVREGRDAMNFSEWSRYDSDEAQDLLLEMCRQVRKGAMPITSYARIHRAARLAPPDVERLCQWTSDTRKSLRAGE
jgi:hypothetical protein